MRLAAVCLRGPVLAGRSVVDVETTFGDRTAVGAQKGKGWNGGRSLRVASATDVAALADALAEAFSDDPIQVWLFPDPETRRRMLRRIFRIDLTHRLVPLGHTFTDVDRNAAAAWSPPGRCWPTLRDELRMLPSYLRIGRRIPAGARLFAAMSSAHPDTPHWHLSHLGVRPSHQGRGLGAALVERGLELADADGLPAYLESSKEENVPFYGRFGFEVVEVLEVAGAPPMFCMWREAG
ncbi:MAG: N-acetyltransferase [Acidimicrobiales bacterium]|nr:MAG: N-acetyltransferase [Acidimicrobiales bacterium]